MGINWGASSHFPFNGAKVSQCHQSTLADLAVHDGIQ